MYILSFLLLDIFHQVQETNIVNSTLQKVGFMDFKTCFQTAQGFDPIIDIASDVAIVYGTSSNFEERLKSWREQGYRTAYMTGISWGNYEGYYQTENGLKKEEIQTDKTGKLWMHGHSTTVGYNVPTPSYVEFIKSILIPPLENKVESIYLEEPEFWAVTGWSEAFKKLWEQHYGEPWSPPDQSVETQYKASLLKYNLYSNALKDVFQFIKDYSKNNHFQIGCYVATHSLINYAQWRIVSPESQITQMENCDGIIAQVWTGTARSLHHYKGVPKERTFETAYLEYAQMVGMALPAQKQLIFLADPIEDNSNYDWDDYKYNYECTVLASLLFPEVYSFEVMPWPERIFKGKYSKSKEERDTKINIIPEFATELLTVINTLNDMKQQNVEWISGNYPIGVIVSDTLMFQRAEPHASDPNLNCFYGIATPLVKNGIPLKIIQMEHLLTYQPLKDIKILLLSYEGQKPLKKEYHDVIKDWVREGGNLLIIDDNSDPYNTLNNWWKIEGYNSPLEHLIKILFEGKEPSDNISNIDKGHVWWLKQSPSALSRHQEGANLVLDWVNKLANQCGITIDYKNYFHLKRGPYHICSVMDESFSDEPYKLKGSFINLFNPQLKVEEEVILNPTHRALLLDLNTLQINEDLPSIIASAGRIREKTKNRNCFSFTIRGPLGIPGKVVIICDKQPEKVVNLDTIDFQHYYDNKHHLIYLDFIHHGEDIRFEIDF